MAGILILSIKQRLAVPKKTHNKKLRILLNISLRYSAHVYHQCTVENVQKHYNYVYYLYICYVDLIFYLKLNQYLRSLFTLSLLPSQLPVTIVTGI